MSRLFCTPFPLSELTAQLRLQLAGPPTLLTACATAFERNLRGARATVEMPWALAVASQARLVADNLHKAAQLRGLISDPPLSKEEVNAKAQADFEQMVNTPESRSNLLEAARHHLTVLSEENEAVRDGATELLRQGLVLLWGGFEVFVGDAVVAILNADSQAAIRVAEAPSTKKIVNHDVSIATLAAHGYDVRGRLGSLLLHEQPVDSLPVMKLLVDVIFPENGALRSALNNRAMWQLFQRRHLIVHQRGVVDARYLRDTGDELHVGKDLVVTVSDLEEYARASCDVVVEILRAASSLPFAAA